MAFNGSGVHNRVHDWTQDLANTIPVTASRMDAEHDDISSSLSSTICRDGQSTTTARIPFASGVSAAAGTSSSVAYAQTNDPNTGLYFPAADQWGLVAGGTATLTSTSTKVTVAVAIDFSGAAAPTSSDGAALGSPSQMWSDLFLASGAVINFNNGDATITHSSNTINFAGATNYVFDAKISPLLDDGAALGDNAHQFSDLHLASGAVTSWNNGDVTLTHSSNQIAVAGGTLACEALSPSGNVAVNTDKFTVAAASGNTVVAGTLAVTGASTLMGALAANNSAGIMGRNTVKAFGSVLNNVLQSDSFNVASLDTSGVTTHKINFSVAMANTRYAVLVIGDGPNNSNSGNVFSYGNKNTTDFSVLSILPTVGSQQPDSYSFLVLSNE